MTFRIVRHVHAPFVNGCRWCGFETGAAHAGHTIWGRGIHDYEPPTQEQRKARLDARTGLLMFHPYTL
jgi:hypothetical protein